jgi:hypothetical protein
MMRIVTIVLFGTLLTTSSFAQSDSAPPKARQEGATRDSQQLWNEMQEKNEQYLKELKEKDPAAWEKLRAQQILDAQEALASFGYGIVFTASLDEKTTEALRNYQTRSGLPVTGDLDTATIKRLMQDRAELDAHIPLGPLYMFLDSDWNNFVKVEGLWLEQGKEPDAKTPVRPAVAECVKSAGLCTLATLGSEGSEYIHLEWYDIQRWDEYEIVTKPDDLPCGRETIHINRPGKTLLLINVAAYKNAEACTKLFGPPSGESVSRLGDVSKLMRARMDASRAASIRIKLISAEAESRIRP